MSVKIFFVDDNQCYHWYHSRNNHHRKVLSFLQNIVEPVIADIYSGDDTTDNYPWCFVFSTQETHPEKYYVGALMVSQKNDSKNHLCAIFSRLSYNRLLADLERNFHLAFWQSRILAYSQLKSEPDNNKKNTSLWISALHRYYSPLWESLFIRKNHKFINTCDFLLSNIHILDNQTSINSGVPFMPWKNWPECIQSSNTVWLWRQSRHGRIIDSKKISIPMDITNVHR